MNRVSRGWQSKGFTIIEVLIVLAIAGVIMLVVFLAVPALQRNSRNNQRKNDVVRLVSQLRETVTNNSGQTPATCSGADSGCFIRDVAMSQYDSSTSKVWYRQLTSANNYGAVPIDEIAVFNFMKCAQNYDWVAAGSPMGGSGGVAIPTGATSKGFVIIYSIETSSGIVPQCVEA